MSDTESNLRRWRILLVTLVVGLMVLGTFRLASAANPAGVATCPEGFEYSRYYAACIQKEPLPAHAHWVIHYSEQHPECDEGYMPETREVVDPDRQEGQIWQKMALLVACEPASASGASGSASGAGTSWWSRQSTGVKVAVVAGGALILIGGVAMAGAALGWWTLGTVGTVALGTGAEGVLSAYADAVAAAWLRRAGSVAAREGIVRLLKMMRKLGLKVAGEEGKAQLLGLVNAALARAGANPWTMAQLEVALQGIDWLW